MFLEHSLRYHYINVLFVCVSRDHARLPRCVTPHRLLDSKLMTICCRSHAGLYSEAGRPTRLDWIYIRRHDKSTH